MVACYITYNILIMLILTLFSSEVDAWQILTKQSFSKRVHHGQIVTGTASDQQVKRTPFSQLGGSREVVREHKSYQCNSKSITLLGYQPVQLGSSTDSESI